MAKRNPAKRKAVTERRPGKPGLEVTKENAALRRELKESRQQQAATANVLKVISQSAFDLPAVLENLVATAADLCEADMVGILEPQGKIFRYAASHGYSPQFVKFMEEHPLEMGRGTVVGRTLHEGKPVHIPDVNRDSEYTFGEARKVGRFSTILGVPMLRQGSPIGVIVLMRTLKCPFAAKHIELVSIFADQAVIAIENARLFNELHVRTRELSQSVEELRALGEVSQTVNSTLDLETVLSAIVSKAAQLSRTEAGTIYVFNEVSREFEQHAAYGMTEALIDAIKNHHAEISKAVALAIEQRQPSQMPDLRAEVPSVARDIMLQAGYRGSLVVPLLAADRTVGALVVRRQAPGEFPKNTTELLQTFAAQSVLAIQNARLFNELRQRTQEVVRLNQQLEQRVADQVGEIERMGRLRRFLPPQVADLIVASGVEKLLESHRREITALFCDLRGFTGFSESSDPEDVIALLSDYHAAIGKIIIKYSGTLERYAGDGVMIVFNDPVPVENPALQAVLMALEMRAAIGALSEKWRRLGHDIGFGIGIAHGFATLGTIGFEGRFDYAAIGTVSNVASRLCDEANPGQILISARVLLAVENVVTVEPVGEFMLKGIRRPMSAYNVIAVAPSEP
jgi:class 3 adenylate cyclase